MIFVCSLAVLFYAETLCLPYMLVLTKKHFPYSLQPLLKLEYRFVLSFPSFVVSLCNDVLRWKLAITQNFLNAPGSDTNLRGFRVHKCLPCL